MHQLLEGFAEFGVEDGVDDGVHEAVDVPQPGGQDESCDPGLALPPQLGAHRVHDVAREEGHPAKEEDTCKEDSFKNIFFIKFKDRATEVYYERDSTEE